MKRTAAISLSVLIIGGLVLGACAGTEERQVGGTAGASPGAKLWAENCIRCHNLRPPDSYSDAQWGVIVHHMRVRAGLTAQEHRAITQFLKRGF